MKKWAVALLAWIAMVGSGVILNIYLPNTFQSIEKRFRDFFFIIRGPKPTSGKVVIVDIDEKSLDREGQWPWERNKVAKILNNLQNLGAGIIGMDIVFAERDKTSPAYLNRFYRLGIKNPPDYDRILAQTIASTPTIPGYIFDMKYPHPGKTPPNIPAIIVERGEADESMIPEAKGVIPNIKIIQESEYSAGFINTIPDESGMIRGVPMLMRYKNNLYPSISLEMLRIAMGIERIDIVYDRDIGVSSLGLGDFTIPTDRHGRILVNFRGPSHTFDYISAVDILDMNISADRVAGKFVMIGTSAAGLFDMRATPFDNVMPGVEIHANVIDNVLSSDFLSRPGWVDGADLIIYATVLTVVFIVFLFTGAVTQVILLPLFAFGLYYILDYILFNEKILVNTLFPYIALISGAIGAMVINYLFETRQKMLIMEKFSKKVSPAVVDDILEHGDDNILESREEDVSVFFSDIRSFTTISERLHSPQRVIELLNLYMTPMTDIILQSKGTVDKFIGDAIMAYWNAPRKVEAHPDIALNSAIEQLKTLDELNNEIEERFGFRIAIGIGINSGIVTVGEMGSIGRSDYTIIGDTVNLASRLEGLNKLYGTHLIISENTKKRLKQSYITRELDRVRVKGKSEAIKIFEVIYKDTDEEEIKSYNNALKIYHSGEFEKALELFGKTMEQYGENKLYELYISRCEYYISHPTEREAFDGVFTAVTK